MKAEHRWDAWVPGYIALRYTNSERTRERMEFAWRFLSLYLEENGVLGPQQVTRALCLNFIAWRRKKKHAQGFNGVCHNTALQDLKLLSVLLGEAVHRGIIQSNPCRDLGLKKSTLIPSRR
jgi:hypothetical protein